MNTRQLTMIALITCALGTILNSVYFYLILFSENYLSPLYMVHCIVCYIVLISTMIVLYNENFKNND
jgi:uncharacterized protein with PQ loop repeat